MACATCGVVASRGMWACGGGQSHGRRTSPAALLISCTLTSGITYRKGPRRVTVRVACALLPWVRLGGWRRRWRASASRRADRPRETSSCSCRLVSRVWSPGVRTFRTLLLLLVGAGRAAAFFFGSPAGVYGESCGVRLRYGGARVEKSPGREGGTREHVATDFYVPRVGWCRRERERERERE
jgi:hypothetical protein